MICISQRIWTKDPRLQAAACGRTSFSSQWRKIRDECSESATENGRNSTCRRRLWDQLSRTPNSTAQ